MSIKNRTRSQAKYSDTRVPAGELTKLQLATGMSDKNLEITTGVIRSWKSRNFFEANVRNNSRGFKEGDIDKYFESKTVVMEGVDRAMVYCNSVKGKQIL